MKKKLFKLTGVKFSKGSLVVDGPIREFGLRGKFNWVKQLSEIQKGVEVWEEKEIDETKVTGKG